MAKSTKMKERLAELNSKLPLITDKKERKYFLELKAAMEKEIAEMDNEPDNDVTDGMDAPVQCGECYQWYDTLEIPDFPVRGRGCAVFIYTDAERRPIPAKDLFMKHLINLFTAIMDVLFEREVLAWRGR